MRRAASKAPSWLAALGLGDPSLHRGDTIVVSTANCAPRHSVSPSATISSLRPSSVERRQVHIAHKHIRGHPSTCLPADLRTIQGRRSCDHKQDLVQGLRSRRAPRVASHHWAPTLPGAPPSSLASAGVANHSTHVATTGQLARGLGSWGGAGTHWRALLLAFAGLVPG